MHNRKMFKQSRDLIKIPEPQPKMGDKKQQEPITEEDERKAVEVYLTDLTSRIQERYKTRKRNAEAENDRPDESFFRKLDSSLKKNSAFVKKVKNLTESQRATIMKDFGALNLTKYVGEIASSLVEVKLKMSDISTAVELSCLAHQRYADFAPEMLENWRKVFPTKKKTDKVVNASKLRVDLRFYAELLAMGVFPEKEGLQLLGSVLMYLVTTDKESGEHNHLQIISALLKFCGFEFVDVIPKKFKKSAEKFQLDLPKNPDFISADKRKVINRLLNDYFADLSERVLKDIGEIHRMERKNQMQYLTKGEVYEDAAKRLEDAKAAFEALHKNCVTLADLLDTEPPELPKSDLEDLMTDQGMSIAIDKRFRGEGEGGGLWEDEDTRQFYETLPELRALLPGILFKDSEKATLAPLEEKIEQESAEVDTEETAEPEAAEDEAEDEKTLVEGGEEDDIEEEKLVGSSTLKIMMEGFINNLPTLVNRDMIDTAATDFVTNLNTKTNRKKLVTALFFVQRTRLDLLPFYSRLVAILSPVMPDVGTELVHSLKMEFRRLVKQKDQIKVESKIKNVRFIGELCKFRIYPKSEALHCFKMLLFDFRHHAIDMACAFLETAGYFLYHSEDSHQKTKLLLEEMMRKKEVNALDQRYQLMIENAFFHCNPPAGSGGPAKIERPPIHDYLRKILFFELTKGTVLRTIRSLRRIDWSDPDASNYAVKCFSSPWMVKYGCIQYLASTVAGTMALHDWVGHEVVDNILEEVRIGMEVNHPRLNQRRLSAVKYLGELYNYRVVDSGIVFGVLYSLIIFGTIPDGNSPLDPPDHLIRIRLVCILLETCGCFFDKGSAKKKLDCFLIYFQRYFLQKKLSGVWNQDTKPFPLEADNLMISLRDQLRPNLQLFETLEEAEAGVKKIEDEYREKVESVLKFQVTEGGEAEEDEWAEGLAPIQEGEEEEDSEQKASLSLSQQGASQGTAGSRGTQGDSDVYNEAEEEEDDDVVKVHRAASHEQRTAEDEEFVAMLDKIMQDTVAERVQSSMKVSQVEIVIPAKLKKGVQFEEEEKQDDEDEEEGDDEADPEVGKEQTRRFQVLLKGRGNKTTAKPIEIPVSAEFVQALEDQEEARKRERELTKLHTLNQARRIEEEELAEAQKELRNITFKTKKKAQNTTAHGFQHQRGAPSSNQFYGGWN